MNIFVYVDESGVFDPKHRGFFVLAGLVLLSGEEIKNTQYKFISTEKYAKLADGMDESEEAKACFMSVKARAKLHRSIARAERFATVVKLEDVVPGVLSNKKNKQRYLDYAIKVGVRKKFQDLICRGKLNPAEVKALHFFVDKHSAPTSARYELRELLEQEFQLGSFDANFEAYAPPLFPALDSVKVQFEDSCGAPLIRASDIVANRVYYLVRQGKILENKTRKLSITLLPRMQSFFEDTKSSLTMEKEV